jgi:subtilase family serine protease
MRVLCGGYLAAYIHRIERDVAAIAQIAFETTVEPGTPVEITVTVANYGEVPESFNVTCYYDSTEIDTIRVIDLGPGDTEDVVFTWDTGGVPLNTYLIEAWADSDEEIEELDAEDNNWCKMELPVFVVPELPFGTIIALMSMIAALILSQQRGHRLTYN